MSTTFDLSEDFDAPESAKEQTPKKTKWFMRPLVIYGFSVAIIGVLAYFIIGGFGTSSKFARVADHDQRVFIELSNPQALRDGVFDSPILNKKGLAEILLTYELQQQRLEKTENNHDLITPQIWEDYEEELVRAAFLHNPLSDEERLEPDDLGKVLAKCAGLLEFKTQEKAESFVNAIRDRLDAYLEHERELLDDRIASIEERPLDQDDDNFLGASGRDWEEKYLEELYTKREALDLFTIVQHGDGLVFIGNEDVITRATDRLDHGGDSLADNDAFESVEDLFGRDGISYFFSLHDHYVDILAKFKREGEEDKWLEFLEERLPTENVKGVGLHMGVRSMEYRVAVDDAPLMEGDFFGKAGQSIFFHFPRSTISVGAMGFDFAGLADAEDSIREDNLWLEDLFDDAERSVRHSVEEAGVEDLDDTQVRDIMGLSNGLIGGGQFLLGDDVKVDATVYGVKNLELLESLLDDAFEKIESAPIKSSFSGYTAYNSHEFAIVLRRSAMVVFRTNDSSTTMDHIDYDESEEDDVDWETREKAREQEIKAKKAKDAALYEELLVDYLKRVGEATVESAPGFYDAFRDGVDYDATAFFIAHVHSITNNYQDDMSYKRSRFKRMQDKPSQTYDLISDDDAAEIHALDISALTSKDYWAGWSATMDDDGLSVHSSLGLSDWAALGLAAGSVARLKEEKIRHSIDKSQAVKALQAYAKQLKDEKESEESNGRFRRIEPEGYSPEMYDFQRHFGLESYLLLDWPILTLSHEEGELRLYTNKTDEDYLVDPALASDDMASDSRTLIASVPLK